MLSQQNVNYLRSDKKVEIIFEFGKLWKCFENLRTRISLKGHKNTTFDT